MNTSVVLSTISVGALVLTGLTRTARAEDATVSGPYVATERSNTTGPNRPLLYSGIWVLGLSYVPAVVVAATSSRDGDKNLYLPVAGPWIDLASRSACPPTVSCNNETLNKVLIVVDGVFQGLGALDIVASFLFPETRTTTVSSSTRADARPAAPSLRVFPAQIGVDAYGLAAIGTF